MADLSLKDRLQPALLDRLTDDQRLVTVYRVAPDAGRMADQGASEQDIERSLGLQGLRRTRGPASAPTSNDLAIHEYVAAGGNAGLSARALRVRLGSEGKDVPLADLAVIEVTTAANSQVESPERRAMSMTRLREAVLRDLRWLFNATGIDDVVDLEAYPQVRKSVVNFGLRSMAGKPVSSIDALDVARRIREAIEFFEPRLSAVRVTPEHAAGEAETLNLSFSVEAELWGQPAAQHVSLRTSIDVENGNVTVGDRAGRA